MSEDKTISAESEVKEEIFLTDAAKEEVKRLISQQSDNDNLMLRVGVEGGGCSGLSYVMSFDKKIEELLPNCISSLSYKEIFLPAELPRIL